MWLVLPGRAGPPGLAPGSWPASGLVQDWLLVPVSDPTLGRPRTGSRTDSQTGPGPGLAQSRTASRGASEIPPGPFHTKLLN